MATNRLIQQTRWLIASHLVLVLCATSGCKSQQVVNNKMSAVKISVDFPTMSEKGEILRIKDSLFVIYYNDYTIYKVGVERTRDTQWISKEGDIMSTKESRNWYDHRYYAKKSDQQKGYYFDSLSAPVYKIINVDSFIRKKISIRQDAIYKTGDSLATTMQNNDGTISETYIRKRPGDPASADTIFLIFDQKLNNISYSLQSQLDSIKKKKLVSVKAIYTPDLTRGHPFFELTRDIYIKMEAVEVVEKKELLEMLGRIRE